MGVINSPTRILPGAAEDYKEPDSFDVIRDKCVAACTAAGEAKTLEEAQLHALALSDATLAAMARFQACYFALMHFAKHGMHMSNMKMVLAQHGRQGEPGGGTWLNGLTSANIIPNEPLFYAAIDAVGRQAVEDAMVQDFNKIQDAAKLMTEKRETLAGKHLEGPIGGPVGPREQ